MKVVIEKGDKIADYEKVKNEILEKKRKEEIINKSNSENKER